MNKIQKIRDIKAEAFQAGEQSAEKQFKKQLAELEKKSENSLRALASLHKNELAKKDKKIESKMRDLARKEAILEEQIAEWTAKVAQADRFLLKAREVFKAQRMEKREIFKKLARHLATEGQDLEGLLTSFTSIKTDKLNKPYLLKKTS